MRRLFATAMIPLLLLQACRKDDAGSSDEQREDLAEPVGSYDIDPVSGEIRASHTDAAGVTTTMRAGEEVVPRFPEPFTAYPGAQITNTTRVEQGTGSFVTVEFVTPDLREKVVAFYRAQAEQARIKPEIEVSAGDTTTLGGENLSRRASFALQVTRVDDETQGQLSVASGFD